MMVCAESVVEFVAAQTATGVAVGCVGTTVECSTAPTRGTTLSTRPCLDLHDLPADHDTVSCTTACQWEAAALQAYRPKPTDRKLVSRVLEAEDDLDDLSFPMEAAAGKQGWSEEDPTGAQGESNAAEEEDTTEGLQEAPQPAGKMAQRKEKRPRDINLQLQKKKPRKEANGCIGDLLRYVADYRVVKGRVEKYNQEIKQMHDSTGLYRQGLNAELYEHIAEQGYVRVRGLIPMATVMAARQCILAQLNKMKAIGGDGRIRMKSKGIIVDVNCGELTAGFEEFDDDDGWKNMRPELEAVASCPELQDLLKALAQGKAQYEQQAVEHQHLLFHRMYTYLRVKGANGTSPEHMDYYFYRMHSDLFKGPVGAPQECVKGVPELPVLTYKDIKCNVCGTREPGRKDLLQCRECSFAQHLSCKHRGSYVLPNEVPKEPWYCHECRPQPCVGKIWIALNDLDANNSVLCVQPGSHKARNLENSKDGRVPTTWFTDFKGKEWHASTFKAGDVVLLNMKTLEAASRNHSGDFRLSLDTRFMLKPLRRNWGETWRSRYADYAAGERVCHEEEEVSVEEDGGAGGASC